MDLREPEGTCAVREQRLQAVLTMGCLPGEGEQRTGDPGRRCIDGEVRNLSTLQQTIGKLEVFHSSYTKERLISV